MAIISTALFAAPALASSADEIFARRFLNYRAKNKISTLRTAEAFAKAQKKPVEQILNRFIAAQWSSGRNSELAVVYGLEAFREKGLSLEEALTKVSDLTGQMTTTLEAMNANSKYRTSARSSASTKPAAKRKALAAR